MALLTGRGFRIHSQNLLLSAWVLKQHHSSTWICLLSSWVRWLSLLFILAFMTSW